MTLTEQQAVFAITATIIMSFIYFLILDRIKAVKKGKTRSLIISLFIWRKVSGFLLLGAIPAIGAWIFFKINPIQAGLNAGKAMELWPWLAGASALFITLNFFNSKSPALRAIYPELRLSEWNTKGITIAVGGWIFYLAGYEFLFRGLLLFSCYNAFGLWPAVVINLALYSALHLPKGMKEAIAAIPFGALICYLTIESQSILPAIFLHSLQAVSCEIFCIYRNPEMNFQLSTRNQP